MHNEPEDLVRNYKDPSLFPVLLDFLYHKRSGRPAQSRLYSPPEVTVCGIQ